MGTSQGCRSATSEQGGGGQTRTAEVLRVIGERYPDIRYGRGDTVVAGHRMGRRACIVTAGRLHLYGLGMDGSESILATLTKGEIMASPWTDMAGGQSVELRAARSGTSAVVMLRRELEQLAAQYPSILIHVLDCSAKTLCGAYDRIGRMRTQPVRGRLAHTLIALMDHDGLVEETHAELAAMVDASREAVTRTLHGFRQARFIRSTPYRHGLQVMDADSLATEAKYSGGV
jgi:CRP-like cAMP-binding protein